MSELRFLKTDKKLKKCPFCGRDAELFYYTEENGSVIIYNYVVRCKATTDRETKKLCFASVKCGDANRCVEMWNTRYE